MLQGVAVLNPDPRWSDHMDRIGPKATAKRQFGKPIS